MRTVLKVQKNNDKENKLKLAFSRWSFSQKGFIIGAQQGRKYSSLTGYNSFMAEVSIIEKPVNWFILQISVLVSI